MIEWPTHCQASQIHEALMQNDPVAPSDLAVAYLELLTDWLKRTNPQVDEHICSTAAEDAILELIKNPASFDPEKLTLDAFLRMSSSGDLKNALRAESRHGTRRAHLELVEHSDLTGNTQWDQFDPVAIVIAKETVVSTKMRLLPPNSIEQSLSDQDKIMIELMRAGERTTAVFAEVMGVGHLSDDEQRRVVKRAKDRLKIKMKRALGD